jgi:chaperonin GroES
VLVRRCEDDGSEAGVVIPESARKPSRRGVVVSVGPGRRRSDGSRCPLAVRAGDIILFGRYTDFDDGALLLIQEADVVGLVEDDGGMVGIVSDREADGKEG